MKNIFFAAIFLFSQLGFSAEKVNQTKAKKFQIENLTFSELLLTKEEIIHLKPEDQTKYIFAMISLGVIIEGSQKFHMGYEDSFKTSQNFQKLIEEKIAKFEGFLKTIFPNANAIVVLAPIAVGALRLAAPMLARAGAWAVGAAERGMASKAGTLAKQMAFEFTPSKEVLKTMTLAVGQKAKNLKIAQDNLTKALKKNPNSKTPLKEEAAFAEARTLFNAEKDAFLKAGGTEAQFLKASNESGLKKVAMWPFRNATSLAISGTAVYGLDTMLLDTTGVSVMKESVALFEKGFLALENYIAGTDISGPGLSIEQLKAGDSTKGKGKSCLYGGVPSNWIDTGEGVLKCTHPGATASHEGCKREDGKFQCPSYGIKLTSGSIENSLCIDMVKLDNLTVRCANTLKTVLEVKAATMDSTETAENLRTNFEEVLKSLQARDRMKNEQGETKSILEYCVADSVVQKEECLAIKEVLLFLKTTDIAKIYETRKQLAASPATPPAPEKTNPEAGKVETQN